jgi:transcriptional regulator with XRE-family HTH domain
MDREGWRTADLARRLGMKKESAAPVYNWANGVNAPGKNYRTRLMKLLNLSESDVTPRDDEVTLQSERAAALNSQALVVREPRPSEQLSFSLLDNGQARIRLDLTGPADRIGKILLLLMQQKITPSIEDVADDARRDDGGS